MSEKKRGVVLPRISQEETFNRKQEGTWCPVAVPEKLGYQISSWVSFQRQTNPLVSRGIV